MSNKQSMTSANAESEKASSLEDRFYAGFEARFRGTREEIMRRQSVYLPLLTSLKTDDSNLRIIDLGCGRGEWLELLRQNGFAATGVDLNKGFVDLCQKLGCDAVYGDAITFLGTLPDESVMVVSAFHLVEHLPFKILTKFISEIYRVLRPNGIVILETPNPENVRVGACNFFLDPTHQAPIPPGLLHFLAESAGFTDSFIVKLNADAMGEPLSVLPESAPYFRTINAAINLLNHAFCAAPDYAVVAQKNGPGRRIRDEQALRLLIDDAAEATNNQENEQERAAPQMAITEIERRIQETEAEVQKTKARLDKIEAHAKYIQDELDAANNELRAVYASNSWRVTAPLRWMSEAASGKFTLRKGISSSLTSASRVVMLVARRISPIVRRSPFLMACAWRLYHWFPSIMNRVIRSIKAAETPPMENDTDSTILLMQDDAPAWGATVSPSAHFKAMLMRELQQRQESRNS